MDRRGLCADLLHDCWQVMEARANNLLHLALHIRHEMDGAMSSSHTEMGKSALRACRDNSDAFLLGQVHSALMQAITSCCSQALDFAGSKAVGAHLLEAVSRASFMDNTFALSGHHGCVQ